MIKRVDESNFLEAKQFIESTKSITHIDDEVLKRASYIYNDKIEGMLSYEKFNHIGLIRYFVFRKTVTDNEIFNLLDDVCKKAKEDNIYTFIALSQDIKIASVFETLGFIILNNEDIYIDESSVKETEFANTIIMRLDI